MIGEEDRAVQQPGWCVLCTRAEELTARDLLKAGYRIYLPRYRKVLWPHGKNRSPTSILAPLFTGIVFAQDWRGFPKHQTIGGHPWIMKSFRGSSPAKIDDGDIAIIKAKENACGFDDIKYPIGPGMAPIIRDDIEPGTEVTFQKLGRRITGELVEMTAGGKAIVEAVFFGQITRTEIAAAEMIAVMH